MRIFVNEVVRIICTTLLFRTVGFREGCVVPRVRSVTAVASDAGLRYESCNES